MRSIFFWHNLVWQALHLIHKLSQCYQVAMMLTRMKITKKADVDAQAKYREFQANLKVTINIRNNKFNSSSSVYGFLYYITIVL